MIKKEFVESAIVSIVSRFNHRYKNVWLFGEWFGQRCCDNSLYLANYIAQNHPNIKVIWAADKGVNLELLDPRIKVVRRNSGESIRLYKKTGVVIMNQGFVDFSDARYNYFSGAVTVNLWHGVPWKKIFLDSSKSSKLGKIVDYIAIKMSGAKYYLSISPEFDRILKKGARVKEKNIIRTGYPRNEILYDKDRCGQARKKIVNEINSIKDIVNEDTIIIAYMPTFRDSGKTVFSFNSIIGTSLYDYLIQKNIVIVEKNHFADTNGTFRSLEDNMCIVNLPDCNAPELLAASDILITDYSSCFFDYLIKDKPIIHYIFDYEEYANNDRGLYYDKDDVVCGDTPRNEQELLKAIRNAVEEPDKYHDLRVSRRKKYLMYENNNSCEYLYSFIIGKLDGRQR